MEFGIAGVIPEISGKNCYDDVITIFVMNDDYDQWSIQLGMQGYEYI